MMPRRLVAAELRSSKRRCAATARLVGCVQAQPDGAERRGGSRGRVAAPWSRPFFSRSRTRRYTYLVSITPSLPSFLSFYDKNLQNKEFILNIAL